MGEKSGTNKVISSFKKKIYFQQSRRERVSEFLVIAGAILYVKVVVWDG
jgi:hypothetical protein